MQGKRLLGGRGVLHISERGRQSGRGNSKAVIDHVDVIGETDSDCKVGCGGVGSHETGLG